MIGIAADEVRWIVGAAIPDRDDQRIGVTQREEIRALPGETGPEWLVRILVADEERVEIGPVLQVFGPVEEGRTAPIGNS